MLAVYMRAHTHTHTHTHTQLVDTIIGKAFVRSPRPAPAEQLLEGLRSEMLTGGEL